MPLLDGEVFRSLYGRKALAASPNFESGNIPSNLVKQVSEARMVMLITHRSLQRTIEVERKRRENGSICSITNSSSYYERNSLLYERVL